MGVSEEPSSWGDDTPPGCHCSAVSPPGNSSLCAADTSRTEGTGKAAPLGGATQPQSLGLFDVPMKPAGRQADPLCAFCQQSRRCPEGPGDGQVLLHTVNELTARSELPDLLVHPSSPHVSLCAPPPHRQTSATAEESREAVAAPLPACCPAHSGNSRSCRMLSTSQEQGQQWEEKFYVKEQSRVD